MLEKLCKIYVSENIHLWANVVSDKCKDNAKQ